MLAPGHPKRACGLPTLVFDLEHLPLKGLANVRALATLACLLLVKLNLLLKRPPPQLKATLYALR